MVAKAKRRKAGKRIECVSMCILSLKTRPGLGIWMSLFLFSLGSGLETFMCCQLLIIHLGGTASVWLCTSYLLIAISNKTSRAEACLELREGICSLPITCSFPVDKSFSFSVPGMVAWLHRVFFGNTGFGYCYFISQHHHPLLRFFLPPELIPAPVPLHVTTAFVISQNFPSSIISLVTAETIKYNNNKKALLGLFVFQLE